MLHGPGEVYYYSNLIPMKKAFTLFIFATSFLFSFSQGKVVINEFMPWTSNTCGGPTAEFVELLNFGPGPVDIGCYILTDGDFSITIPPNTILQPGQFYVISGENVISVPCANIDSTITTDLNWNTCNCTSGPIPSTGDGLFTDGGAASEQVVLLSPSLSVVDAVARTLPVEPSAFITTSALGGLCTPGNFDLDLLSINYEIIGESAGRGNSFARKLDGDCGWVKDPQQSADATNNTPTEESDVDYSFAVTNASTCLATGSIGIVVNAVDLASLFPMEYTLAYDTDGDHIFELTDSYTTGQIQDPGVISIDGLVPGNYRVTIGSSKGCFLRTFPFTILMCGTVLAESDIAFQATRFKTQVNFQWRIVSDEAIDFVILEAGKRSDQMTTFRTIPAIPGNSNSVQFQGSYEADPSLIFFRLRVVLKSGKESFSKTIQLGKKEAGAGIRLWPNPVKDQLFVRIDKAELLQKVISYSVFNGLNQLVAGADKIVLDASGLFTLPVSQLSRGSYLIVVYSGGYYPLYFRFMKL